MAANSPTSMLFSLNGKDFMASYKKLEASYRYYKGTMQTLAQWSDTDGGGRFTKLISLDYISYLKQSIHSGKYKSGVPYNEMYGRLKAKKDPREWILDGNIINNISVIYRGKHTQTVGILRNFRIPRKSMNGKIYKGKTISVAKYAMINEFGFAHHPARPIFQPAMRDFIKTHFPPMAKAFERAMKKAADKEVTRINASLGSSSIAMGDIGNVVSQASLDSFEEVGNANIDRDFSADIFSEGLSSDSRPMSTKDLNKSSSSAISKDVEDEMVKMAKGMGMTVDELNEFLSNG